MEEKLVPFFESSIDMLCIANYEGYFVDVNPAFISLLGYTQEELFSKKINEFVFEEDRYVTQKVREGIQNNVPLINFQNRYVHKSGALVWLSWSAVPVIEEKLVYAIAKDVTHEIKLRNERIQELAKLKNSNEDLIRLNYTTSHDLRAPVNNLLSLFDLLDYDKIKDAETSELLTLMKVSAEVVKNSLENYVDLVRNIGSISDSVTEIYFENVLSKIMGTVGSLLTRSKTQVKSNFAGCKSVFFNEAYMESIFLNLITNSVKYGRPGIAPVIHICTALKEDHTELIFSDEGQGFNMEKDKERIFGLNERFNDVEEGKGVGLYLVQNQLKSLGGTIRVDSAPNKGATFRITFPNKVFLQAKIP